MRQIAWIGFLDLGSEVVISKQRLMMKHLFFMQKDSKNLRLLVNSISWSDCLRKDLSSLR